jgi:hypothetical protein
LAGWLGASSAAALERLEPGRGCYLGFNLGEDDTPQTLATRLGLTPAVFVRFYAFPLSSEGWNNLNNFCAQVRDAGAIALVTLEPFGGLSEVTTNVCEDFANFCAAFEAQGIAGIILRFAHEMNGTWYAWGQQPLLYREKFRLLAQAVHARTTRTALLWAPNHGAGYPFVFGGPYKAQPGTDDFAALDTNSDGALSEADDMYEPYYPGDDAVDWVGMTIYHWGANYPWLENELPLPNSFARALTGNAGQLPDFYARYCADGARNKPLAVPETSGFYNTQQPGANEFAIKQAWWQQVFNLSGDNPHAWDVANHFPKMKCVGWFDHYKIESEAQSQWIDWRVSACPQLRDAFLDFVRAPRDGLPYFLTAPEAQRELAPYAIVPITLPHVLPLNGALNLTLATKVPAGCDLVMDLLDETYQWFGGTRVAVAAGQRTNAASFALVQPLRDGAQYRWSIFLTPSGGTYLEALAWLREPRPVARVAQPAVEIVNAPAAWLTGSNLTARVRYTVTSNAVLHLNLLDAGFHWRTGTTVSVRRVDSVVELTLPPSGLAPSPAWLEAVLSDSPTNQQSVLVRSSRRAVRLEDAPSQNRIGLSLATPSVLAGDVFRVLVNYGAHANAQLRVELLDAASNLLASAVQPVPAGSSALEMTLSHVGAAPGTYPVRGCLTPPGGSCAQALASAHTAVDVHAADYRDWVLSYWGVVLGTDAVAPSQDADGDQASNGHEFQALTSPRDPAQVLAVNLSQTNGQIFVRWPSVMGRNYRVYRAAELSPNAWTPVSSVLPGTGATLEFNAGVAGSARSYFQVQVAKP